MSEQKRRVGRPSKYKPWMNDVAIEHGKTGGTKAMIAADCGIDENTLLDWCNPNSLRFNEEFSRSVSVSTTLSKKYWEKYLSSNIENKDVSPQLFSLLMRNQHGYDSKANVQVEGGAGGGLTLNITLNGDE